ncbi:MAG: hypothetical protein KKA42_15900, partial [candidate division Zixibacteria bacterium]|nr:hypothetical protein [candidate division Zixibacteria bacterium]
MKRFTTSMMLLAALLFLIGGPGALADNQRTDVADLVDRLSDLTGPNGLSGIDDLIPPGAPLPTLGGDTVMIGAYLYGTDSVRVVVNSPLKLSEITVEVVVDGAGTYTLFNFLPPAPIPATWFFFEGTGWTEGDGEHVELNSILPPGDPLEG